MKKRLKLAAALAFAAPVLHHLPSHAGPHSHQRTEVQQIETLIESLGTPVLWAHDQDTHCRSTSKGGVLLGFYDPRNDRVVMCPAIREFAKGPLGLIKHEGWHAIQHKCNKGQAVLSDDQIRARLTSNDRQLLRQHYKAKDQRLEAEARAVSTLSTATWVRGAKKACNV